ncbi:MAG: D-glycerate dehydrogenase [Betaproteobacteria bacterium]|nr:D-glycerate dehydrogenase [Betaproteobacteria bacterium]
MRPRIYITQPVAASAIERLRAVADVELNPDTLHKVTKAELLEKVPHLDILFCLLHDMVDRDVIAAGKRLRAIASMKITPSDIDVPEATARRIPVTVIAPIVTEATADVHFALLLAVARRVFEGDQLVRAGIFPGAQSAHLLGAWVYGKTIGLIGGGGRIGKAVAKRAQGFSMRTLYWTPRRKPESEEREAGLTYVPYDQLLAESDFVSVHAPLTPETRHLVGERELRLMKPTAFLVNTARGPIVEEKALVRALAERRIAGAGLDVFENEPEVEPELLKMRNVVLTPHLGSAVTQLRESMANVVADNIIAVLEGRQPPNCWNAEIYASSK